MKTYDKLIVCQTLTLSHRHMISETHSITQHTHTQRSLFYYSSNTREKKRYREKESHFSHYIRVETKNHQLRRNKRKRRLFTRVWVEFWGVISVFFWFRWLRKINTFFLPPSVSEIVFSLLTFFSVSEVLNNFSWERSANSEFVFGFVGLGGCSRCWLCWKNWRKNFGLRSQTITKMAAPRPAQGNFDFSMSLNSLRFFAGSYHLLKSKANFFLFFIKT